MYSVRRFGTEVKIPGCSCVSWLFPMKLIVGEWANDAYVRASINTYRYWRDCRWSNTPGFKSVNWLSEISLMRALVGKHTHFHCLVNQLELSNHCISHNLTHNEWSQGIISKRFAGKLVRWLPENPLINWRAMVSACNNAFGYYNKQLI